MQRIHGTVQQYDWGDTEFLPSLLGEPADGRPWAELWLGTHPNGPAVLDDGRALEDVTGPLPYLLKVLSAARPLSLQAHPDARRAREGHAVGRYPDPNAKPELLVALTPFDALCGFRPIERTLDLLDSLGADAFAACVRTSGPTGALEALLRGRLDHHGVVDACRAGSGPEAALVTSLSERYPDQPSPAATLLLNLVRLDPGEALHLRAGILHAYLAGSGIELMGASDNVVRAGLTTKPVDVDELLAIVDAEVLEAPVHPRADRYALPEAGVALVSLEPEQRHCAHGHELAIGLDGIAWHLGPGDELTPSAPTYVVTAD